MLLKAVQSYEKYQYVVTFRWLKKGNLLSSYTIAVKQFLKCELKSSGT